MFYIIVHGDFVLHLKILWELSVTNGLQIKKISQGGSELHFKPHGGFVFYGKSIEGFCIIFFTIKSINDIPVRCTNFNNNTKIG